MHRPLARVPENTLKFGVSVMLPAFGVFWTGEGLGIEWPGGDLALVAAVIHYHVMAAEDAGAVSLLGCLVLVVGSVITAARRHRG